ncbi:MULTISPECIES: molybdenum cofactor guanylyltransferase [Sphingobacterium]|uniref:molybdenum cofactor guanylyltransferase n=1 Tax=Sphingobacterium TaxID=28453 RepID=UPI0013DC937B|nr:MULTISPECIES: molybdenum cofactor guanylyltransferase [unclassified Sphingobacterium]
MAGGKSSRMGKDKGLKMINQIRLIEYLLLTLRKIPSLDIVIIAHNKGYEDFGVPIIEDVYKDKGPLGGIFTALSHTKEDAMIISVDTPFISQENLMKLLKDQNKREVLFLENNGKNFPLCAVYSIGLKERIEKRIKDNQLKLFDFLETVALQALSIEMNPLERLNLNTPEDLFSAEQLLQNENSNLW